MRRIVGQFRFLAVVVAAILAAAAPAAAQTSSSDKDSSGQFTGIALITDDPNWRELFKRPETPQISGASRFKPGQRGVLAIMFSNAEPRQGRVRVICDVTAFDPKGSHSVVRSAPCYEGPFAGPNILHPVALDLQFEIGADDPAGRAGFEVTLRDAHSRREVELHVTFIQERGP